MTDNARNKIQSQNSFKWHHSQKAKMFIFAKMFGWVKKSSNMAVAPPLTWSTVFCAFLLIVLRLRILCFPSTNFTCLLACLNIIKSSSACVSTVTFLSSPQSHYQTPGQVRNYWLVITLINALTVLSEVGRGWYSFPTIILSCLYFGRPRSFPQVVQNFIYPRDKTTESFT